MKKILLTGAAGRIGTALLKELGDSYHIRCLDRQACPGSVEAVIVNILDFEAVLNAMQGIEAVIHLASNPSPQSWDDVYTTEISGTYNVFEAARLAGVRTMIYASSTHVLGYDAMDRGQWVEPSSPVSPDSLYAVGKACGELLGQFFVDRFGLSVICLRIGYFTAQIRRSWWSDRLLGAYCSPRDLAQLIQKSLQTSHLGFQIFYGVSANQRRLWDIQNAQEAIGYEPQDNIEDWVPFLRRKHELVTLVGKQLRGRDPSESVHKDDDLDRTVGEVSDGLQPFCPSPATIALTDLLTPLSGELSWNDVYTYLGNTYKALAELPPQVSLARSQPQDPHIQTYQPLDRSVQLQSFEAIAPLMTGLLVQWFERSRAAFTSSFPT